MLPSTVQQKSVKILSENLKGQVEVINLKKVKNVDLSLYNRVIIGGSIYMGKIPKELLNHASAKEYFGGEFAIKRMGFMDRLIVKKVSKIDKDVSNLSKEKINRFVQAIS